MGKVLVSAKIESVEDAYRVKFGLLQPEQARMIEIDNALIDTGAYELAMPTKLISALGLTSVSTRTARTAGGLRTMKIYGPVRLTILGRFCTCDVAELPDECPVCVGQIPLESLDFIVDPRIRNSSPTLSTMVNI